MRNQMYILHKTTYTQFSRKLYKKNWSGTEEYHLLPEHLKLKLRTVVQMVRSRGSTKIQNYIHDALVINDAIVIKKLPLSESWNY